MHNRPKVSIILPCYNVEKFLDRCMNSIVNQTLQELEIILIDDKSLDGSPQKCDEWASKDSRIKVVHKSQNEGLGFARNTGLTQATGEYIVFVDSDDFVSLNMYETLYSVAVKEDADAVYSNCIFYKDDRHQNIRYDVSNDTIFRGRDEVDQFLLDMVGPIPSYNHNVKYMMSVWHGIYRKSLFDDYSVKFVSERQLISEDLVFDIDYLCHCNKIVFLKDAHYYYCDNGASLSRKVDKTRYERLKIWLNAIEERLNNLFPLDKYKLHYQRQQIHILLYSLAQSLKVKELGMSFDSIINDSFWNELLNTYPFKQLPFKEYLLFYTLRKRSLRWIAKAYLKR